MNEKKVIRANRQLVATKPGDWTFIEWVDIYPETGSFVSTKTQEYEIHGRTIIALNVVHAYYKWSQEVIHETGEVWGVCCHCNHAIRYAVIFLDSAGKHHMVGETCGAFIGSGLDPTKWAERRLASSVELLKTKNGNRYVIRCEVPGWYWPLPRVKRPAFVSTSKFETPGRKKHVRWYMTVWGDTPEETIMNWETLQKIRHEHKGNK